MLRQYPKKVCALSPPYPHAESANWRTLLRQYALIPNWRELAQIGAKCGIGAKVGNGTKSKKQKLAIDGQVKNNLSGTKTDG